MFVKISYILVAIIPLSSAQQWKDLFKPVFPQKSPKISKPDAFNPILPSFTFNPSNMQELPLLLEFIEPYIPKSSPCHAYQTLYQSHDGAISSQIRVPWDYSSIVELKVKLVFGRRLPNKESNVQIKMVQPTDKIIYEGLLYNLKYANQQVIPQLTEISINGRVICQGPPEKPLLYGPYQHGSTTLTLIHKTRNLEPALGELLKVQQNIQKESNY